MQIDSTKLLETMAQAVFANAEELTELDSAIGDADHGLNMSTLESRPSRERAWEYVFWVDLDADVAAPATRRAIEDLGPVTTMLRVLGSYPRWPDR